jgi:hypothetical protein
VRAARAISGRTRRAMGIAGRLTRPRDPRASYLRENDDLDSTKV